MIKTDIEAFIKYTKDAHWYNKVHLSRELGYKCGVDKIPESGKWIVRPITNLKGMGRQAVIDYFKEGTPIEPGMFYCEVFEGPHITIDYIREHGNWSQHHTFEGFNTPENLTQFSRWKKVDYTYKLQPFLQNVEADHINIEVKGDKIIEAHLRPNPDPVMYDDFWPIWSESQKPPFNNYVRIPDKDDETEMGRLGFFVPQYKL
jgi:hypothetical protein